MIWHTTKVVFEISKWLETPLKDGSHPFADLTFICPFRLTI
jgi:hypothetical protein